MSNEKQNTQVDKHSELFQHYSNLLFKARVLILTVIFLAIAYLTDMKQLEVAGKTLVFNVGPITCFLFANVISLLFSMETGYIRRLAEVAKSFSKFAEEKSQFHFFQKYNPILHEPFIIFYILVIIYLGYLGWSKVNFEHYQCFQLCLYALFTIIPFLLFVRQYNIHKKLMLSYKPDDDELPVVATETEVS